MKKRIGLIAVIMMLVVSIVSIDSVFAKGKDFSLTKAEVGEKAETVTLNKFSYKGSSIKSDVTFHKVGDYVTYKLVLKNTSDETLTIKSITDSNKNKNVTYSYDKSKGVKIKSGNTLTLLVKAKYAKAETDTSKRSKKLSTTFTINYVDSSGKSGSSTIDVNPGTGDKIMLFSGILVSSLLVILVVLINKKKKISKKTATLLMILSLMLPIGVSAASGYNISFTSTYKLMDRVVVTIDVDGTKTKKVLDYNTVLSGVDDPEVSGKRFTGWVTSDGKDFDMSKPITKDTTIKAKLEEKLAYLQKGKDAVFKMVSLSGARDIEWVVDQAYSYDDHTYYTLERTGGESITKIKFATESQYNSVKASLTSDNVISTDFSDYPIYAWFNNGTIYLYSEASKVSMNQDSSYLFSHLPDLTEIDFSHFDTSKVTNMSLMFYFSEGLTSLDLSNFDTSKVTTMELMFGDLINLTSLNLSGFDTSKVTDMSYMFWECHALSSLDVRHFDTSKVTNLEGTFSGLESLTSLDLSTWNTSNVTNMLNVFVYCHKLADLDISSFDTSKVTTMSYMFWECFELTSLDLRHFDTSSVEDFSYMFDTCTKLQSINMSGWDTSSATDMSAMFLNCPALTSIDVSSFNTSNVVDMDMMFDGCSSLTNINVTNFDVSKVTNMSNMFSGCTSLETLDLTSFNTRAKVPSTSRMFENCSSLTTIYATSDFVNTGYNVKAVYMFRGCTNLVGGAGTTTSGVTDVYGTYGRIDDPDNGKPGFYTAK